MGTEVASDNEENITKPGSMGKPSELEQKIIRQIEYYFGDYNLKRDRFLKEEMEHDSGWVALETLIKFNRLKQLSEDFSVISEALKKSPNQLMEVNDDCTKIRRIVPVSVANSEDRDERSIYVKGFKKDIKLDELLDFFQDYKTENIFMRKKKQGTRSFFKGSVFVTFKTKEDSEAFLEKEVKYNKVLLQKERKKEYMKRKDEFYNKLRAERDQKSKEKKENLKKEVEDIKSKSKRFEEGCLLRITGLEKDSKREDVKEAIETYGKVAFLDYFTGNEKGIVRFEKGIASDVFNKAIDEDGTKKLEIGSLKITISLIEGEEEKQYFDHILQSKANFRLKGQTKYGNKGRFNKYRGKRQKDNTEDIEEQPSSKRQKLDQTEDADNEFSKKRHVDSSSKEHENDLSSEKDKNKSSILMEEQ